MKKIVSFILIIAMFILASCGKPSDMSDSTYGACKKIIECTDQYVNMDITYSQFSDKFYELKKKGRDSRIGLNFTCSNFSS